jgi:hypothetical protein
MNTEKTRIEKSLVNCTPHDINVFLEDGSMVVLPKSNAPARCGEVISSADYTTLEVQIVRKKFGDIENLPDPVEGIFYVVSAIIKAAAPYRKDLLLVNDTVRNEKGVIIGCKSFAI